MAKGFELTKGTFVEFSKDELKALVGRLTPRHNTNLGGGTLAGLDHAQVAKLPAGMLVRVILFTDGLANEGPPPLFRQVLRLVDSVQRADLSKAGQLPKPDGVGKVRQSMQKAAP